MTENGKEKNVAYFDLSILQVGYLFPLPSHHGDLPDGSPIFLGWEFLSCLFTSAFLAHIGEVSQSFSGSFDSSDNVLRYYC